MMRDQRLESIGRKLQKYARKAITPLKIDFWDSYEFLIKICHF